MADDFRINIESQVDLSKAKSDIDKFLSSYKNDKLKISVAFDTKNNELSKIQKEINQLKSHPIDIKVKTSGLNNLKKTQNDFKILKNLANEIGQKKVKIASLDSNKNSNQIKELSSQLRKLQSDYDVLYSSFSKNLSTSQIGQLNNILGKSSDRVAELNSKTKDLSENMSKATKPFNQLDAVVAGNKTLNWLNNNTKAAKEYGEVLEDLARKQKSATNAEELANYNKQVKSIISDAQVKGLAGKSAIDEIGRAFKQIGQFATTYGIIQNVEQLIVESISDLKDMNSILTEISKTSDLTTSQLKELGKSSFESASQFGKTAKDYLLGVQEMSRSGFYGEQAEELAKLSILGQAAGDMSADVSNSYLLATNAAYDYKGNAEKLNAVLDGQNMITNRNSVAMQDMAEATTQAGSQAAQYGVEIDQLSALVGTAVARTKKSGNEVGTALKALFINLQNTQNAKITGTFDKLGISMTKMVGDSELLKTPIELLKELSKVYTSLPEGSVEKADILTNIGGKHHANVLSSILSGYSDYEKMLKDYSEGTGSAAVEAEKSANNWEGSLNKLSNSWTSFVSNFANSDLIITGTNALTEFVKVLDTLTSNPLLTAGTIAGGFAFFKNLDKPEITR
uniref:Minor tail protein n=1 Tax=Siphoviridae sp. ctJLl6 TaxID=2827836 RepID=A0A8S5SC04_9CAUD|nr:MAG TPA: minor tail protein [Siphoviridae sp. ctJLl6]